MDSSLVQLMDHPLLTEVLFYPTRVREEEVPQEAGGRIEKIPVGSETLGAYLYSPLPSAPTLLFFHGNGEVMTDYLTGYHRRVSTAGANFLVVDYRGYGLSNGQPSLSRLREDALAAWDHAVKNLGLAPREIILMGRSLGSLAALELAGGVGRSARGLILESAIARFDDWMERMAPFLSRLGLPVPELQTALKTAFDHETKLRAFPGPVLIMHTLHDEIVPVHHAHLLSSWAEPSRTTFHLFPHGGHNDIQFLNWAEYFRLLQEFISSF